MLNLAEPFDVISFDAIGQPFDGWTPELSGLGGSESQDILVLEALAARGLRVLSLNRIPSPAVRNGVRYVPLGMALAEGTLKTKTLILNRTSALPANIEAERVLIRATDVYNDFSGYGIHEPLFADGAQKPTLVCVSEWQAKGFPAEWPKVVIPNMLPDWVYDEDRKKPRNAPAHAFIYASAALKGLQETINLFGDLRKLPAFKNATLDVCCPAYSAPGGIEVHGVRYLGSLGFRDLVSAYQKHRHLLHVSTFPETFGIAHVLAEVLGLCPIVMQSRGTDALTEVLNSRTVTADTETFKSFVMQLSIGAQSLRPSEPKDYRASTIIEQWLDLIGVRYVDLNASPGWNVRVTL